VKQATLETESSSPAGTEALGERLGRLLAAGDLVCLSGPLGAGKTVLVRGLALGLGCDPRGVASPTYVLERTLPGGRVALRHLDAYRLSGAEEFEAADLASGPAGAGVVSALEWSDRVEEALPPERLELHLEVIDGDRRRISVSGRGERYRRLVDRLRAEMGSDPA
jgi:tRNA threonylcarbamoyladenosine biosynthesis protein TsaE